MKLRDVQEHDLIEDRRVDPVIRVLVVSVERTRLAEEHPHFVTIRGLSGAEPWEHSGLSWMNFEYLKLVSRPKRS